MNFEMTVMSTSKRNLSNKKHELKRNWRFFTTWLRIICLYPLNPNGSKVSSNTISLIIRFGLWVMNVASNISQIFLFYYFGYDSASPSEYWNAVIDYWNWTAHNLAVHYFIVFVALRENHWMQLIKSLQHVDNSMRQYKSKKSSRLKNKCIMGLFYIALTVRI